VRLTRVTTAVTTDGHGNDRQRESVRWTVYGADASGAERIYVEHESDDDHDAWRAVDPLWQAFQQASIRRLLANPGTRDLVLQVNIRAALNQGDLDTAAQLAKGLSLTAWQRLTELAQGEQAADDAERG